MATATTKTDGTDSDGSAPPTNDFKLRRRESATRLIPGLEQMAVSPQRPRVAAPSSPALWEQMKQQHQNQQKKKGASGDDDDLTLSPMATHKQTILQPVSPFRVNRGSANKDGDVAFGTNIGEKRGIAGTSQTPPHGNSPTANANASCKRPLQMPRDQLYCDLTPVTRNTFSDDGGILPGSSVMAVSPDDGAMLHGEHLAMPTALDQPSSSYRSGPSSHHAPSLPPLPNRRTTSVGQMDMSSIFVAHSNRVAADAHTRTHARRSSDINIRPEHMVQNQLSMLAEPISLPQSGRSHTFTSREEYEEQQQQQQQQQHQNGGSSNTNGGNNGNAAAVNEDVPRLAHRTLIPYQPTRHDLTDLRSIPQEALNQIFISRANRPPLRRESSGCEDATALANPMSLGDRTWSIPSLHMANRLASTGSLTSLASYYTDEEDSIHGATSSHLGDDNASVNSRSSLYLSESHHGEPLIPRRMSDDATPFVISSTFQPVFVGAPLQGTDSGSINSNNSINNSYSNNDHEPGNHNANSRDYHRNNAQSGKRKRSKKEKRAIEWLRTVEANPNGIAEAASSKFLIASNAAQVQLPAEQIHAEASVLPSLILKPKAAMGLAASANQVAGVLATPVLHRRALSRQTSSPATLDAPLNL